MKTILIRGGSLASGQFADVLIRDGIIREVAVGLAAVDATEVDASGYLLLPGLVDIGAALTPEQAQGELDAATAAGVSTFVMTPTGMVPLELPGDVRDLQQRQSPTGARGVSAGAMTIGLAGEGLTDMAALRDAGCIAVSNGPNWIANSLVMRSAMRYAAELGLTVLLRPVDPWLGGNGCAHAGRVATRLGLEAIPVVAETTAIARDLVLIEETGVHAHIGPISTAAGAAMIMGARARGLPVTADTTIHHLFLTELDLMGYNPDCHLLPPLREPEDRDALRAAVAAGELSVRSDHTPLSTDAKTAPFPATEPGAAGLPSLLGLALRLVDDELLEPQQVVEAFSLAPARALGLPDREIAIGNIADLVVVDPDAVWQIDPEAPGWPSRGHNTPCRRWEVRGRAIGAVREGAWTDYR